jgi:O-antigen/teichoic acid export membrane protein
MELKFNSLVNSEIKKGSVYLLASSSLIKLEEFLVNIIIARWLFPEDFGLYGLTIMILGFYSTLGNWGTGTFIIYKGKDQRPYLSTALTAHLLINFLLALLLFISAPLVSSFFKDTRLISLQILAGFILIFQSLWLIPFSLLQSQLKLGKIASINLVVLSTGFILTLILARAGFGAYSLLVPSLTNAFFLSLFYWGYAGWRPRLSFYKDQLKEIFKYGRSILGADLNSFLLQNIDFLLIGKFLSIPILGIYKLAFSLSMALVAMLGEVVSRVTMPAFSLIKDNPGELSKKFHLSLEYTSAITVPLFSVLLLIAPFFIPILYQGKWNGIIIPFQIFCLLGIFSVINKPCNSLLNAIGKPYIRYRLSLLFLPITILFVLWGLKYGLVGVSAGYSTATILYMFILFYLVLRQIPVETSLLIKRLLIFFLPASIMIMMSVVLNSILFDDSSSNWNELFFTLGSGLIFYFLSQLLIFPSVSRKFYGQLIQITAK